MYTLYKNKKINELKKGDILKRKSNNEFLKLRNVILQTEGEEDDEDKEINPLNKKRYFCFSLCGYVRDKVMSEFFASSEDGIAVYRKKKE